MAFATHFKAKQYGFATQIFFGNVIIFPERSPNKTFLFVRASKEYLRIVTLKVLSNIFRQGVDQV